MPIFTGCTPRLDLAEPDTPDLPLGDQIEIAINVLNNKEVAGRKRTLGVRDLVFQITVQFDHERAERHGYDKFLNLASHWFIAVPRKRATAPFDRETATDEPGISGLAVALDRLTHLRLAQPLASIEQGLRGLARFG